MTIILSSSFIASTQSARLNIVRAQQITSSAWGAWGDHFVRSDTRRSSKPSVESGCCWMGFTTKTVYVGIHVAVDTCRHTIYLYNSILCIYTIYCDYIYIYRYCYIHILHTCMYRYLLYLVFCTTWALPQSSPWHLWSPESTAFAKTHPEAWEFSENGCAFRNLWLWPTKNCKENQKFT